MIIIKAKKNYGNEIVKEIGLAGYLKEEFDIDIDSMTCSKCASSETCEYAFDAYNTDGDCLAIK